MTSFDADLRRFLDLLVRVALNPDAPGAAGWRTEAETIQAALAAVPEAARPALKLDGLWTLAVRDAERDPAVRNGQTVNPVLPVACPFDMAALTGTGFDVDDAAASIRASASTG